jgi:hypothetical protein
MFQFEANYSAAEVPLECESRAPALGRPDNLERFR